MDNLIFLGSPRPRGYSTQILDFVEEHLSGSTTVISAYKEAGIRPCIDCRYCWTHPACAIEDEMSRIYDLIEESKRILIISPVYFYGLPAPLKLIVDRCQVYWAKRVRTGQVSELSKQGASFLVGGAPAFATQFTAAELEIASLFTDLGVKQLGKHYIANTDKLTTEEFTQDLAQIKQILLDLSRET